MARQRFNQIPKQSGLCGRKFKRTVHSEWLSCTCPLPLQSCWCCGFELRLSTGLLPVACVCLFFMLLCAHLLLFVLQSLAPGMCVLPLVQAIYECNMNPYCGGYSSTTSASKHILVSFGLCLLVCCRFSLVVRPDSSAAVHSQCHTRRECRLECVL